MTQLRPSHRIQNIPPYPFATLAQNVRRLIANGHDIIRLDIGNPDLPPAPHIVDTLVEKSRRDDMHGYGGYVGLPALREAMASYYQTRYGVTLNPTTEILPLIGSKEGLMNMHLAWLDPGDLALIPDPGYSAYEAGPQMVGAEGVSFRLHPEDGWLPRLSDIPADVAQRARLMWLNYPNNPTGGVADLAFFEQVIDFCRQNQILLCHDNAYGDVTFEGYRAVSPLQVSGAKDVVIEFNSLSKTYNVAGWRIGMAVGNETAVQALANVKTNIDSGLGLPIQHLAITALTSDQSWLAERNRIYQQRRDVVIRTLSKLGINVPPPKATLYIWFPVPTGYTDVSLHEKLLSEAHVSIAPGYIYGQQGRNWMRLSVSASDDRLAEAMARLQKVQL